MTDKRREVEELQGEIAKVDAALLQSLERRARLSRKIGEARREMTAPPALPDGARMEGVLRGATGEVPGPALREIFREIFATCFSLEEPVSIAFAGIEGGFTHAAARSRFGVAAEYHGVDSAQAALDEVTRQRATYAVVPFETRTDGVSGPTLLALAGADVKIVGAFELVTNLQLATRASSVAEIQKVYALAKDRAHCLRFLSKELPGAQVLDTTTPLAACQLAAADERAAALVHEGFVADYPLEILVRNVRDEGDERVRYATVGARPASRTGDDYTAFLFSVSDTPGALHEVLKQFADRGVNLTKIQSRPTPGDAWQYLFFVEVHGHATDRNIVGAMEDVRRLAKSFKVLGSYRIM